MECYKILGIDENASTEEVREAYERKVNQFKKDIEDEKRLSKFLKVFDEAYEEIITEREKIHNQKTMVMDINEFELSQYLEKTDNDEEIHEVYEESNYDEDNYVKVKKGRKSNINKKTSSGRRKSANKNRMNKTDEKEDENIDNKQKLLMEKGSLKRKQKNADKEGGTSAVWRILKIIIKIAIIPVIALLSLILFILRLLKLISWAASKIIMISAIAAASIHGYQIYIGQAANYSIFIICAAAFISALLLPSILNIVPSILEGINNRLKGFM